MKIKEFDINSVYVVCPRCGELTEVPREDYDSDGLFLCDECGQEVLKKIAGGEIKGPVILRER